MCNFRCSYCDKRNLYLVSDSYSIDQIDVFDLPAVHNCLKKARECYTSLSEKRDEAVMLCAPISSFDLHEIELISDDDYGFDYFSLNQATCLARFFHGTI